MPRELWKLRKNLYYHAGQIFGSISLEFARFRNRAAFFRKAGDAFTRRFADT
jgi:hypothetical protein